MKQPVTVSTKQPVPSDEPEIASGKRAHPIDAEGWRQCARDECGQLFKPDTPSRAYCGSMTKDGTWSSTDCAALSMYKRHGMVPLSATLPTRAERTAVHEVHAVAAVRRARVAIAPDPDKERAKETRYGPMRDVATRLDEHHAVLVCGHKATAWGGRTHARCHVCRDGGVVRPRGRPRTRPVVEGEKMQKRPVKARITRKTRRK